MADMEYKVVGNTTASNPGNGCMRFNTAGQADATQLYFCKLSAGNIDVSGVLASLAAGDILAFTSKNDGSTVASYTVASDAQDNSGWFTVNVTPVSNGGSWPVAGNTAVLIDVQGTLPAGATAYEYYMAGFPAGEYSDKQGWLNQLGAVGWRLIGFGGLSAEGTVVCVFIRELA